MKNIFKTAFLLIVTLVVLPIVTYYFDSGLNDIQLATLKQLLVVSAIFSGLCFLVSELSKNYSQVDKIWSIMPIVYVWIVAYKGAFQNQLILAAVAVSVWGIRLTYNFSRRGAYSWKFWSGEEDYRWSVLRKMPMFQNPWNWRLFNLFFISLYQNFLILLFTIPVLKLLDNKSNFISHWAILFFVLILVFVLIETIADQQQWNYQKNKKLNPGNGFVNTGLWKLVRHPNYTSEQAIWIFFYLFCASQSNQWFNWTMAGCLLLIILFQGSADFSEGISESKYPEYKTYKKKTGRFIPKLF